MTAYHHRLLGFLGDVFERTPFVRVALGLFGLWLVFASALWFVDHDAAGTPVPDLGSALYWAVAAFSTAGIADVPATGTGKLIGGIWIVVGSVMFFGAIVATVTGYFMRPLQRPVRNLIDTIENNLEHIEDLSYEELELLRQTADGLIEHMEKLKARSRRDREGDRQ